MKNYFIVLLFGVTQLNYGTVSSKAYAQWITNFIQAERVLDQQAAQENQLLLEGAYYYMRSDEKGLAEVEKYLHSQKIGSELPSLAFFIQGMPTKINAIFNRKLAGITPQETKEQHLLARKRYYAKEYTGASYDTTLQSIAKNIQLFSGVVGKDNQKAAALLYLTEQSYDQAFAFYKFIDYEVQASNQEEAEKRFREYSIALTPGKTPDNWLKDQFIALKKTAELINDAGKKLSMAQDAHLEAGLLPQQKQILQLPKGPAEPTKEDLAAMKEAARGGDKPKDAQKLTQAIIDEFVNNFKKLNDALKSKNKEEALLSFSAVESFYDVFKKADFRSFNTRAMPKIDATVIDGLRAQVERLQK